MKINTDTLSNSQIFKMLVGKGGSFDLGDESLIAKVNAWPDSEPTPLQVLEILDLYSEKKSANDNTVNFLRNCYHVSLEDSGVDHDEVVKGAAWR